MELTLGRHIKVALGYFVLAAVLGTVLRFFPVTDIPIDYRYMVHTHSHIALMGWVYLALTVILGHCYLDMVSGKRRYRIVYWVTQLSLVGMLFTFPFQGYALFSITFSTLFLFCSYAFFAFFVKHVRPEFKSSNSLNCIKAAFWFMVLSSIGPWALGAIMSTLGPGSIWYRLAIYFYLHFQYNGWMVLALVGLLLLILEKGGWKLEAKEFNGFLRIMIPGVVLSFFLSTLWTDPHWSLYVLGGLGGLMQAYALLLLWKWAKRDKVAFRGTGMQRRLLRTAAVLLAVKMTMQLLTALPYFARLADTYLDFTIGYLHLTFLGAISIGIFFLTDYFGLLRISKKAFFLYLFGFLATESLIFYRGLSAWLSLPIFEGFLESLALGSLLIPMALLGLLANRSKPRD